MPVWFISLLVYLLLGVVAWNLFFRYIEKLPNQIKRWEDEFLNDPDLANDPELKADHRELKQAYAELQAEIDDLNRWPIAFQQLVKGLFLIFWLPLLVVIFWKRREEASAS